MARVGLVFFVLFGQNKHWDVLHVGIFGTFCTVCPLNVHPRGPSLRALCFLLAGPFSHHVHMDIDNKLSFEVRMSRWMQNGFNFVSHFT